MPHRTVNLEESTSVVNGIDLSQIRFRIGKDKKLNWTGEKINFVEQQYRQFLVLWRTYPREDLPPSEDVDEFWHAHILDTKKYFEDCDVIFGAYRHHFPYFGLRGTEDEIELAKAFDKVNEMFLDHFGIEVYEYDDTSEASAA